MSNMKDMGASWVSAISQSSRAGGINGRSRARVVAVDCDIVFLTGGQARCSFQRIDVVIALREAYRAGLFQRRHWMPNIVSGVVVGVVALPLAMAFAIASGVKPEQGLYTAIIAGLCVSIFGGSRLQIAGPTGAF